VALPPLFLWASIERPKTLAHPDSPGTEKMPTNIKRTSQTNQSSMIFTRCGKRTESCMLMQHNRLATPSLRRQAGGGQQKTALILD
jgi:hypothetical protein